MNLKLQAALEATKNQDESRFLRLLEPNYEWVIYSRVLCAMSVEDSIVAHIPDIMKREWVETSEGNFEAPTHIGTAVIRIGRYKTDDSMPTVLEIGLR